MISSINWSVENFFGLFALTMGLLCSIYFFYEWVRHYRKQNYLLLWSISLALFYVFLIPFIQIKFSEIIILTDWTNFFIPTVPFIFLGWVLIYWTITQIKSSVTDRKSARLKVFLLFWVLASFIFYFFRFSSTENGKLLSIIGLLIFFITIHVFILSALWKLFKTERWQKNMRVNAGIIFIASAIIISIVRYLFLLNSLMRLPGDFWFLSIASFDFVFILRSVVVILLTIGFVLIHKHYLLKSRI